MEQVPKCPSVAVWAPSAASAASQSGHGLLRHSTEDKQPRRACLAQYLLKKESLFEAQVSQLQEEVKALREAFSTAAPSQPVARKMPVPKRQPVMVEQSHGPPPKKSKAASKAANVTKLIIVKIKGSESGSESG